MTGTDCFLARLASRGDSAAFAELARRHDGLIRRHVWRTYHDHHDQDDLRQEALLGLLEACRNYRPGRAPFPAFASHCIHDRMLALIRHVNGPKYQSLRPHVQSEELLALTPDPQVSTADLAELRADIFMLAGQLPGRLSARERQRLAGHLNGQPATRSCDSTFLHRARRKARALLEEAA